QRLADPLEVRLRSGKNRLLADAVGDGVGWLTDRTRIFAATDVGAETVGIGDPDGLLAHLARREHDPAELGVDRDLSADRAIAPAAEVGGADVFRGNGLAGRAGPDHQALLVAVIEGNARHETALHLARVESTAADRRGEAEVGRQPRRCRARLHEERGGGAERAEEGTVRRFLLVAIGRRAGDSVGAQPPDENPEVGNVGAPADMAGRDSPYVDAARHLVEGAAEIVERVAVAKLGGAAAVQTQVIDVLVD